eukprot:jgi/Mesvir1/5546/Mv15577-RA.2
MLQDFLPVMDRAVGQLSVCLRLLPPASSVDLNELFHKLTIDIIGDVALGVQFGLLRDVHRKMVAAHAPAATLGLSSAAGHRTAPAGKTGAGVGNVPCALEPSNSAGAPLEGADDSSKAAGAVPSSESVERPSHRGPTGDGNRSQRLYELLMEWVRLSNIEASISMPLILLFPPLGRPLRWLLSYVPGTNDYRFRLNQVYGVRTYVQMCIDRRTAMQLPRRVADASDAGKKGEECGPRAEGGRADPSGDAAWDTGATATRPDAGKDAMTLLLSAVNKETKQPFSMERVASLATELIAAGSDTTANTLAFALYCVSGAPHVEAKLVEEVLAPGRGPGVPISYADLDTGFLFVEAVINEALRLYPPASTMARVAQEDTVIGGHKVAAGTWVFVPALPMNKDPAIYPDPDVFRPERFLYDKEGSGKAKFAGQFNPFGMGPRMCLGHRMAMVEAKLVLIRLYQSFSFVRAPPTSLEEPLKLFHTVVTKPKNGVWMHVLTRAERTATNI